LAVSKNITIRQIREGIFLVIFTLQRYSHSPRWLSHDEARDRRAYIIFQIHWQSSHPHRPLARAHHDDQGRLLDQRK
jgi:hypothetical protein